jgi:hypothetical protein
VDPVRPASILVGVLLVGCGKFGYDATDFSLDGGFAFSGGTGPGGWGRGSKDGATSCPFGYSRSGTSCYRYESAQVAWMTAEASCEGEGAHLIVVDDASEEALIATMCPGNVWIGLTDTVHEGQFVPLTGGALSYVDWGAGQPDDSGGHEDVVEWRASDRRWNDALGSVSNAFLCEFDGGAPVRPWPTGTYCDTRTDLDCGECGHVCPSGTHCADPPACR